MTESMNGFGRLCRLIFFCKLIGQAWALQNPAGHWRRNANQNQVVSRTCFRVNDNGKSVTGLSMGLYDKPLPPRPPPREEPKKIGSSSSEEEDDDDVDDLEARNLFSFNLKTGDEVNDLLPSLGRRLDMGIACYFEPSDRLVQNLVDKTSCNIQDACWALEACRGDITEAWTRISFARRMQLQTRMGERESISSDEKDGDVDFDDDWDEEELEKELQRRKKSRLQDLQRRNVQDSFRGGEKDAPWLPKSNPQPLDDEPWFTG